jgi:predicted phage terminase large subunit-like protein
MLPGFDCYIRKVVEDGKVIFPEAFCLTEAERTEALEAGKKLESIERLRSSNQSKFYGQYLNDPLDEERLEFKRDWFQRFVPSPELSAQLADIPAIVSIDPAFRLHQYNDFTGIVVTKTTPDNLVYVMEARAIKVNPDMLVKEIFSTMARYKSVYKLLVETVTSQIMLMNLLQNEMKQRNVFFVIEEVKPENNERKTVHIRSLIPHYANRRIFHAPGLNALEEQLMEFPKGAHDDIIDALAYQVKYWHGKADAKPSTQVPEGSYAWWQKKIHRKPNVLGKLFNDFKRT